MEIINAAIIVFTILKPFLDAWIIRSNWTPKQKTLVTWATSILLGTAFVVATGGWGALQNVLVAIPAIYGYSQAIYQFLVKNLATKFEALTTGNSAVITPAEPAGTVTITSDETIKAETNTVPVETPVQINTTKESVEIYKSDAIG